MDASDATEAIDATGTLAARIDALLPQTQCRQCGFDGCLPYARAIAAGQAPINRCPPGGDAGVKALAGLLDTPVVALDRACGTPGPLTVAVIDEQHCIGCTLCLKACPVDAIVGANRRMHTVVAEDCTGCALCLPPCPVDCIVMVPVVPARDWTREDAASARRRHRARAARLATRAAATLPASLVTAPASRLTTNQSEGLAVHGEVKRDHRHMEPKAPLIGGGEAPSARSEFFTSAAAQLDAARPDATASDAKHAAIAAALARARARRASVAR